MPRTLSGVSAARIAKAEAAQAIVGDVSSGYHEPATVSRHPSGDGNDLADREPTISWLRGPAASSNRESNCPSVLAEVGRHSNAGIPCDLDGTRDEVAAFCALCGFGCGPSSRGPALAQTGAQLPKPKARGEQRPRQKPRRPRSLSRPRCVLNFIRPTYDEGTVRRISAAMLSYSAWKCRAAGRRCRPAWPILRRLVRPRRGVAAPAARHHRRPRPRAAAGDAMTTAPCRRGPPLPGPPRA